GVLWAGSNDGLVHISRDGGSSWDNVTANIPGLPPLGTVRNIDASRWDAAKAYITVDFHQVGNFEPFVYKTEDYGASWTKITSGIAGSPLSYVRNIRQDPVRPGLLYLGTENALYASFDDGANWQPLQTNLPPAPIYWMVVQEHFNDLVVGTYGRGFWILDDITPLQQLTPEVASSEVHLFQPRPAYRFRPITQPMTMFNDPSAGENPPYGASINYWLAEEPEGKVEIRIADSSGEAIRTLEGKKEAGINRLWWDLEGEPSDQIKLRSKPLHADWVDLGEERWLPARVGRISVLAPPGEYTLTLQVGGQEYTRQLQVLKDPHSEGSLEDIRIQTEMLADLREDMNAAAALINRIEWIRRQLYDLRAALEERENLEEVLTAAAELDKKLIALESNLLQLKVTGTGQDRVRWPTRLAGKLSHLANGVAVGDFPPTDQQREVHQLLRQRLKRWQDDLKQLEAGGLAQFQGMLSEQNLSFPVLPNP
ncbi:MAG: sialidase, partial [Acidobacteriota bacterium]